MHIEEISEGIKMFTGVTDIPDNRASSNIIIQNCAFKDVSHTPVIFSSRSVKGISRVFISGLDMDNSEAGVCIYGGQNVKTHDVFIKDILAINITNSFFYSRMSRTKNSTPVIFNIQLDSIYVKQCGRAFLMLGRSMNPIRNVNISNSEFIVSRGSFAKHLTKFSMRNVEINGSLTTSTKDIGENKIPKIYLDNPEDEVLDSDDIQYDDLPVAVKNSLSNNYPYVPINDVDRIITSTNVIYEIDLEFESFQNIEVLIQVDGEIIRSELETNYESLPEKVISELEHYLGIPPTPFLFNEIMEIHYKDFTYYEIKGEYNQKLFAIGISNEGRIIEEKQQNIDSYFLFD
jgi:hypothetical protein